MFFRRKSHLLLGMALGFAAGAVIASGTLIVTDSKKCCMIKKACSSTAKKLLKSIENIF